MALEMRGEISELTEKWRQLGAPLIDLEAVEVPPG